MAKLNLADNVIAHIAYLVQMAILTQTDVTDRFRLMTLVLDEDDPNRLVLSPEYLETVKREEQELLDKVAQLKSGSKKLVTEL